MKLKINVILNNYNRKLFNNDEKYDRQFYFQKCCFEDIKLFEKKYIFQKHY